MDQLGYKFTPSKVSPKMTQYDTYGSQINYEKSVTPLQFKLLYVKYCLVGMGKCMRAWEISYECVANSPISILGLRNGCKHLKEKIKCFSVCYNIRVMETHRGGLSGSTNFVL